MLNDMSLKFNDLIENLNLVDVCTSNSLFTRHNQRIGDMHITSRQDRFLISKSILSGRREISKVVLP